MEQDDAGSAGTLRALRRLPAIAVVTLAAVPSVAAADEVNTLLPGGHATVKGTHISCGVTGSSVTCTRAGGLTATIVDPGKVHVRLGSRTQFSSVKGMRLGINGAVIIANVPIYCHVYAAPTPTTSCSKINPKGGLPRTYGFDIGDHSVVVFRFDAAQVRHDLKTFV